MQLNVQVYCQMYNRLKKITWCNFGVRVEANFVF